MELDYKAPATAMLPELLPFLVTIQGYYPVATACQLEKMMADCSALLITDDARYNSFSLLTAGGFPVEFTFRCDTDDLYITTETGGPDEAISGRIKRAQLYAGAFSFAQHALLRQFSKSREQRYGCWLGLRYKGGQPVYKLYHEAALDATAIFLYELLALTRNYGQLPELTPMMAGFIPGFDGIAEFYCRIPKAGAFVLHQLFAVAGVAPELNMVLDYLGWLAGMNREALFKNVRFGVSFQVIEGHRPGITIFVHVNQLCRPNIETRSRLIKFAGQLGYPMPFYELVSERLLSDDPAFPVHGILSIKPMPKGKIFFSFGLRPW